MSLPSTTSHVAVGFIAVGHLLIGVGIGWGIGPIVYNAEQMMVRGSPATVQPGLETLFPKVLGWLYISLGMGLLYSIVLEGTSSAIRTALVPCLLYHLGAAVDALSGGVTADAINHDKMNPSEVLVGHLVFIILGLSAYTLSKSYRNDMNAKKKERKYQEAVFGSVRLGSAPP